MTTQVRLHPDDLAQLAAMIADCLANATPGGDRELVDAVTLAADLGISAAWIREHADELGAVRLGDGPRPRLRFNSRDARRAYAARTTTTPEPAAPPATRARTRTHTDNGVELLPIGRTTT